MLVVPSLHGVHHRILVRRWGSVRRLVEDAQHVLGVEVLVVVGDEDARVSVGVIMGIDAVVLVSKAEPWAVAFIMARPWVPIVVASGKAARVVFARTPLAS